MKKKIIVTGAAGFIGSVLCGQLLNKGYEVIAVDSCIYGGDSLIAYKNFTNFTFLQKNIFSLKSNNKLFKNVYAMVHLAALVGYPICKSAGRKETLRVNYNGVKKMFGICEKNKIKRFIFSSTYSNYGISDNDFVNEESELNPQSDYAVAKVKSEKFLIKKGSESVCKPIIFRFATVFGISPRTRNDLIINQFVHEAIRDKKIIIFEGNFYRSFVNVKDVVSGICIALKNKTKKIENQVFNLGSSGGNITKYDLVKKIQKVCKGTKIIMKKISIPGDMRDIKVDYTKIKKYMNFEVSVSIDDGIKELKKSLENDLFFDFSDKRHRNSDLIIS